ncbi:MAG: helix-turn-helix transcriptional regulator [Gemmatimonadota bacterium]
MVVQRGGTQVVRLIRIQEVLDQTGLSRSSLGRMERAGRFPKRRRLDEAAGPRSAVAWNLEEVEDWCARRPVVGGRDVTGEADDDES